MASSYETFKELDLTKDEVERLGTALKDKEFRKLLVEYVEELQDPENKKIYEQEITQLEKERGNDVTFINPVAGYVIKTSVNGNKKAFVNICANENIKKPTSTPKVQDGSRGLQWSLPHSLAPPREDVDNKGVRCQVFDVVFHPDTLHLAQNNKAFRSMVNNTACDAVEASFDVKLDRKNLKFPKLQYKGMPHSTIIKRPSKEKPTEKSPEEQAFYDQLFSNISSTVQKSPSKKCNKKLKKEEGAKDNGSPYTTPTYVIKHRNHIELEEFTEHKHAKLNATIPKELVVEVDLPLLKSASDLVLDVAEKNVQLCSEKPAKYKLALTLPYQVNQDAGNAKFDKDLKKLIITLPVRRSRPLVICDVENGERCPINGTAIKIESNCRDDSGVESDHGSPTGSAPSDSFEEKILITEFTEELSVKCNIEDSALGTSGNKVQFLEKDVYYSLPEHACHVYDNILAFTLNVKNVSEGAIEKLFDTEKSIHVKFHSISSGFYPVHYAFYVKLEENTVDTHGVSIEAWDNNVVVQIPVKTCDKKVWSYFVGVDEDDLVRKYVEDPAIINTILESSKDVQEDIKNLTNNQQSTSEEKVISETSKAEEDEEEKRDVVFVKPWEASASIPMAKPKTKPIDIVGAFSESSGDELSCSYSPSKCKGILKRLSSSRTSISRSISESSVDDIAWASSFENCHASMENVIPENGEISSSLKKTVRFKDVVSRQLFRSNSSILGQKKKNQRKARNKKRAQERRHSESELSETEDKKERDSQAKDEEEEEDERSAATENINLEDVDFSDFI